MIYFITLFGIKQVLFFLGIVKVCSTGRKNVMELLGYSTGDWLIIIACASFVAFWLSGEDWDG